MDLIGKNLGGCELIELVGRGGMGEVYRACQLSLEREVAVKVLASRYSENEEFRERFKREARSIAKVNHPNILQIYEVGEANGTHFMVMEFISGESLGERLAEKGYIPWAEAIEYVIQSASGLASASWSNIIHRDIKPDNLMITEEGIVKVSDFGLAKECTSVELTQTDAIMGTPAYMSPEQCDGVRDLDTRTDIYSLGGALYRMLTGVLPFNAPNAVAMLYKHKHEEIIPPEQYMPSLPANLAPVINKMMAKDRKQRYQNMDEVVEALKEVQAHPAQSGNTEMTMKIDTANRSDTGRGDFDFDSTPDSTQDREKVIELIARGEGFIKAGRPLAAFTCWQKALALDPGNPELRKRVERAKSESTVASLKIAEDMLERGALDQQRRELNQIIKMDPDNIEAVEKLQALDLMESRKRQIVATVRQHLSAGRYNEAIDLWDSLHKCMQDKILAQNIDRVRNVILPAIKLANEAEKFNKAGKFEEALEKWQEAAELDPSNDRIKMGIQETKRFISRIENLLREAYEYEVKGNVDAAIDCYDTILRLVPSHKQAGQKIMKCLEEEAVALDNKGLSEEALKYWKKILGRDPNHVRAEERVNHLKGVLAQIQATDNEANGALHRGQYSKAIRGYTRILRLDPNNRSAVIKCQRARKQRLVRHILPIFITLLAILLIAGVAPRFYRDILREEATALSRNSQYDKAISKLQEAEAIPFWGMLAQDEIAQAIEKANFHKAKNKLEELHQAAADNNANAEAVSSYREELANFRELVRSTSALSPEEQEKYILSSLLEEGELLFHRGAYEESATIYREAVTLATTEEMNIPTSHALRHEGINSYLQGLTAEKMNQQRQAIVRYETALKRIGDFTAARERLKAIREAQQDVTRLVEEARQLIAVGMREEVFAQAQEKWHTASAKAAEALEIRPDHPDAQDIIREVEWRLDAGPEMVLFMLPDGSAFAIDRYEFPNQEGVAPKIVNFYEARKLARETGKELPTPKQWIHAARGGDENRTYPWGERFSADRVRSSIDSSQFSPVASGSLPRGRSKEGLYEMSGNLAEWVDSGEGTDTIDAVAMGGHFGSTSAEDLTSTSRVTLENPHLANKYTGFRCIKVYSKP